MVVDVVYGKYCVGIWFIVGSICVGIWIVFFLEYGGVFEVGWKLLKLGRWK